MNCIRFLSFFTCSFLLFSNLHLAAQSQKVFDWLEESTAAVVFIDDIPEVVSRIEKLPLFQSEQFAKAIQIATNEESPIMLEENWDELKEKLREFFIEEEYLEEVLFVIHEVTPQSLEFSILLKTRKDSKDLVTQKLDSIAESLDRLIEKERSDKENDNDSPEQQPTATKKKSGKSKQLALPGLARVDFKDWIIVGNSEQGLQNIVDRMSGLAFKKRSLKKSRIFNLTQKQLATRWTENGLVHIFLRPNSLRDFFPKQTEKMWNALRIHELPGCAIQVELAEKKTELRANGVLKFTFPPSGIAKQFLAYEEIEEVPSLPHDIELLDFQGVNRSPKDHLVATRTIYDEANEEGSYDAQQKKRYEKFEEDFFEKTFDRSAEKFTVVYKDKKDRRLWFLMERVNDYEGMEKFIRGQVKFQNRFRKGFKITELDAPNIDGFILWGLTDENLYKEYKKRSPKGKLKRDQVDYRTRNNTGFALSEDWYIQGNIADIEEFAPILEDAASANSSGNFRDEVADLEKTLGFQNHSIKIEFETSDSYRDSVYQFMHRYLVSKFPEYKPGQRPPKEFIRLSTELSQHGRFKPDPKNRKDIIAAVQFELLKGLLESFNQRLTLYSREDHILRIGMKISSKRTKD